MCLFVFVAHALFFCSGFVCQSTEKVVSPTALSVAQNDLLLAPGIILSPSSVVSAQLSSVFYAPLIQSVGGEAEGGNITLSGQLSLSVTPLVPRDVYLAIVESNGELYGRFSSIVVVSNGDPCVTYSAQTSYSSSSLFVLLSAQQVASCTTSSPTCATNPLPCQNGATCSDTSGGRVCVCPTGFTGTYCDVLVCPNSCSGSLKGTCTLSGGIPQCVCTANWTSSDCSVPVCTPSCLNGGLCVNNVCNCTSGFQGEFGKRDTFFFFF